MRGRITDMTKKRVVSVILLLVFSLLVLSAKITPFLQLSPFYFVDSTPLYMINGLAVEMMALELC